MTIVIRYVNCTSGKISERTIGTVSFLNTSSEYLYKKVVEILKRVQLDVKGCRGQGYDGASNMSGYLSRLAARI